MSGMQAYSWATRALRGHDQSRLHETATKASPFPDRLQALDRRPDRVQVSPRHQRGPYRRACLIHGEFLYSRKPHDPGRPLHWRPSRLALVSVQTTHLRSRFLDRRAEGGE